MNQETPTKKHRIYTMPFARVYPEYVNKAERKGRTKAEVDEIIGWLMGYSQAELDAQLANQTDVETFVAQAPRLNPARAMIKGTVCGVRVEDIAVPMKGRSSDGSASSATTTKRMPCLLYTSPSPRD